MFRQIACIAVLAAQVSVANAQEVREIEPEWRVVTRDGSAARSGPDGVYYTVTELDAGRVVRVDGEAGGFARVRYPESQGVLVPVDEIRLLDQNRVELVKASGLRAPSELMGLSGSWMAVFDPALPSGTVLTIREAVTNDSGDVVGYQVAPPQPPAVEGYARMYISADALRDATPAEIAAHLGQEPEEAAANQPADDTVAQESGDDDGSGDPSGTDDTPVAGTDEAATDEPASIEPGETELAQTELTQTEPGRSDTTPVEVEVIEQVPADSDEQAEPTRRSPTLLPADLEQLESAFEFARKQPAAEVDQALDELLAEFKRTRDATTDDDRLAWQLDQRIEWLKIRIETRDQRRAIRAALAEADSRAEALQSRVADWQRSRAYQLVGLLVESSVYNGERLPRMYRVQAVSTLDGSPRTLGYLMPDASMDRMLGSVVGIIGEARFDPQLRLMVIRPERVDVMPK